MLFPCAELKLDLYLFKVLYMLCRHGQKTYNTSSYIAAYDIIIKSKPC